MPPDRHVCRFLRSSRLVDLSKSRLAGSISAQRGNRVHWVRVYALIEEGDTPWLPAGRRG